MSLVDGIIAYYKFDGNSNDFVGSHNNADTDIVYSNLNGKINQGAGFNGSTSFIRGTSNFADLAGANKFTISFWVLSTDMFFPAYLSSMATNNNLFQIRYYGGVGFGIAFCFYNSTTDSDFVIYPNSVLPGLGLNVWNHVVYTYDGTQPTDSGKLKLYINNVSTALDFIAGPVPSSLPAGTAPLGFGTDYVPLNGSMDEVGIWNRPLTSMEVSQLYNGGSGLQYPFKKQLSNFLILF